VDFEAAISALQGFLGEDVFVVVSLRDGAGALPCAMLRGPLARALEVGVVGSGEAPAIELRGDLSFDVGVQDDELGRGSFIIRPSRFERARWADSTLIIHQAGMAVSVTRQDDLQESPGL
jgi:hypothetical protein